MRSSTLSSNIWIVVCVSILVFLAVRAAEVQFGRSPPSELTSQWLSDVARTREQLYSRMEPNPDRATVWIVAGSNALFGTNSRILAERLDLNVRNYALQGSVNPDMLFSQVADKVAPGDIVLMPMEWGVFGRSLGAQFDYANYIHHFYSWLPLSAEAQYRLFSSVPLSRWWDGLVSYIYSPADEQPYAEVIPTDYLLTAWDARGEIGSFYSMLSLTQYGDINVDMTMAYDTWDRDEKIIIPDAISVEGAKQIIGWKSYFEGRGVTFFLTSPVLLEDKAETISTAGFWRSFENYRERLGAIGVDQQCDPEGSIFANIFWLDSIYHLNTKGAALRSNALADCLGRHLAGEDVRTKPVDPNAMAEKARELIVMQKQTAAPASL